MLVFRKILSMIPYTKMGGFIRKTQRLSSLESDINKDNIQTK